MTRFNTTLTLSKPLNPSRRKSRQCITHTEILASMSSKDAAQPSEADRALSPWSVANQLKKKYPVLKSGKPLYIGAGREILSNREWPSKQTRAAIYRLTHRKKYLEALAAEGSVRYRLDGSVDEPVSEHHRQHARRLLDELTKKNQHGECWHSVESCDGILVNRSNQGGLNDD